jgi:hypothetical protein
LDSSPAILAASSAVDDRITIGVEVAWGCRGRSSDELVSGSQCYHFWRIFLHRARSGSGFYYVHKPTARAHTGLAFGPSPKSRSRAHTSGQARKSLCLQCQAQARPEPAFYRPDPALLSLNKIGNSTRVTR